jgi:NADH-quinone oxidoreductase subunit G
LTDPTSAGEPSSTAPGVPFTLDGRPSTANPGELLISAAERTGTYIPRFCYHPRMKPVGMCRMCLVEVSGPRGATLQPACFVSVSEGMEVTTDSDKVKKAQDGVLEFLLANHPLDCPVCDKGGECPLQDQTLAYGPGESRFVEEKRHFEKPIAISELVLLDRERCIQCARCTRFAEDVAGEAQIDFAGRGERVEVATFPDEPFSSYFSGNTVQICPVGALTATPYRFTARPWDLDQVESTCTTCAFGCRVAVQSSANRLTRLLGIDAEPVNHGWLCDKGRFVFESVNGDEVASGPEPGASSAPAGVGQFTGEERETGGSAGRLTEPMVRKDGELVAVSWNEALAAAARGLAGARDAGGPEAVAVLGGARLTNESAYAWAKMAKAVIGTDSVDAQLADGLPAELVLSLPRATIDQACSARTVVLLSGDVREELPVLYLRLREAALDGGANLVELAPRATSLTRYAAVSLPVRPGDAPATARAVTGDDAAAALLRSHPEGPAWSDEALARARELIGSGDTAVVVVGRPSLAEHEDVVAEAARTLATALPGARFLTALRRGNVLGALDMGLSPGLLPGRVSLEDGRDWFAARWGSVPRARGLGAAGVLASLAGDGEDRVRALVALGTDVTSDFPDRQLADRALSAAAFVVTVSGHPSPIVDCADVVLPAAVTHERPGTTTNVEGRLSRLGQKLVAPGQAWPDWMIATELAAALGGDLGVSGVADLWDEIERVAPAYAGATAAVLDSPTARDGVLVPFDPATGAGMPQPIDPIALPGVESVERQGAPPRVGLALGWLPAGGTAVEPGPASNRTPAVPPTLDRADVGAGADPAPEVPAVDSYSLRLVASRRLYDGGAAVGGSPSLAPLVPEALARANPYDLDRLGAATGDRVRVRSARGTLELPAEADAAVPRGVVAIDFNLPSADGEANAAANLIDAAAAVTEVRLESLG